MALVVIALVAGCNPAPGGRAAAPPAVPATPVVGSSGPVGPSPSPSPVVPLPRGSVELTAAELKRVPRFPPPPPAVPMKLPGGESAAWLSAIPTTQKVAFITIDDGWEKNPKAFALLRAANVPVSLFLQTNAVRDDVQHFRHLTDVGATIEAHSVTHQQLTGTSYEFQKREICGSADQLGKWFGRRPTLFRPPFGAKDATTLKVVRDCRMKAAFFWTETTNKGKVFYQQGRTVKPGDIILMHFRPAFVDDFLAVLKAIKKAGLTPARLQDYLPDAG